ncbi:MAG: type II toxin-antitoxin system PemK/MazF family toxin [Verrucomicrobiota bacterium]
MKAFDIYTWNFPGAGEHPAVILGTDERIAHKPKINVLLCTSQRVSRPAKADEVLLNGADGLDWETLCKCDLIFSAPKEQLTRKRGTITIERRRQIAERIIRVLGFAGL